MTHNNFESAGRDALVQMTPAGTIGDLLSSEQTDNIATLRFSSHMAGYAGWNWVVSLAVDGDSTTILETELVAGDEAVIAPDWVPWADRLREYEESVAAGIEAEEVIIVDEDELDDDDDDDDDVFDGVDDASTTDDGDDEYVIVEDED
ncbi:MAG: hypothetical protein RLZZ587_669 [Actinomycetota bacterium]